MGKGKGLSMRCHLRFLRYVMFGSCSNQCEAVETHATVPTSSPSSSGPVNTSHLPALTEVPLPGPSEPVKLALAPPTGDEPSAEDLEKAVNEISAALNSLDLVGASAPQHVAVDNSPEMPKPNGQLTLKDMPAAVWLPRLGKRKEPAASVPMVADQNGLLRPVATPHSIAHAPVESGSTSSLLEVPQEFWPKINENKSYMLFKHIQVYIYIVYTCIY